MQFTVITVKNCYYYPEIKGKKLGSVNYSADRVTRHIHPQASWSQPHPLLRGWLAPPKDEYSVLKFLSQRQKGWLLMLSEYQSIASLPP